MKHAECQNCKRTILGKCILVGQQAYHPSCFVCHHCHKPLEKGYVFYKNTPHHLDCKQQLTQEICQECHQPLGQRWVILNTQHYHRRCAKNHSTIQCQICNAGIVGAYIQDKWGTIACSRHKKQQCSCCQRLSSPKTAGTYQLSDGRVLCGLCHKTSLKLPWRINALKREIMDLLRQTGFQLPSNIPLDLVSQQVMAQKSRKNHTKGLTQTLTQRGKKEKTHRIFVLFGLPEIEFKGVFAHELLHVWLHEHDVKWSEMQTEGFCNLGTFLVYSQDKSSLGKELLSELHQSKDKIYGDGFRLMHAKLKSLNWSGIIQLAQENPKGYQESLWKKIFG